MDYLPFPIPDPSMPWSSTDCYQCEGKTCYGHFLKPGAAHFSSTDTSQLITDAFVKLNGIDASDSYVNQVVKACPLPLKKLRFWFDHLQRIDSNRKRGA